MKMNSKIKLNKESFVTALIAVFLCFILLAFLKCNPTPNPDVVIEYRDSVVYVPKIKTVVKTNTITEIKRDPYLVRDTVFDTVIQRIYEEIDKVTLAEIARKHYQLNYYQDTLVIDSLGFVYISDTLQANRIKYRSLRYDLKVAHPGQRKAFLSAGVSAGGNKDHFDFGVGAMFTTKNRLTIGYDYYGISNSHIVTVKKSIFNFK